jgi:hypothetical protein
MRIFPLPGCTTVDDGGRRRARPLKWSTKNPAWGQVPRLWKEYVAQFRCAFVCAGQGESNKMASR